MVVDPGGGVDLEVVRAEGVDTVELDVGAYLADAAVTSDAFAAVQFVGRLTYDMDASKVLPVSTRTSTSWTFRSTGPSGSARIRHLAQLSRPCRAVPSALCADAERKSNVTSMVRWTRRVMRVWAGLCHRGFGAVESGPAFAGVAGPGTTFIEIIDDQQNTKLTRWHQRLTESSLWA